MKEDKATQVGGHRKNRLLGWLSKNARQAFPIAGNLKSYKWSSLPTDIVVGITVGAVTVPSAMAYAQVAGLSPVVGLYAALGAMTVFAVFSDSRQLVVGPEVALATIAGASLANLAGGDSQRALQLAAVLALMVGAFCALGAIIRLGFIAEFLSRPILLGYLMGIALVIISAQLPKMLGFSIQRGYFFATIWRFFAGLGQTHAWTLLFSAGLVALGLVIGRFWKKVPGALVILVVALLLSHFLKLSSHGFSVIGNIQKGLPSFTLPHLSWSDITMLLPTALAMSVIAFADTITPARAYAAKNNERTSANRTFFSLGTANMASGFLGGMPVSASGSRTALNYSLGAKSQVAQLIGAATIATTLLLLTPILKILPTAALAVILVLAAIQLFDIKELVSIWKSWRFEGALAIVTMLGVAGAGVLYGLGFAIVLAILNLLYRSAYPHDAVLGRIEGEQGYRDLALWPEAEQVAGLIVYRFDAPLFFANASHFRERVEELITSSEEQVEWLVLDAEQVFYVDSTACEMFEALLDELESMGVTIAIARMKGPVRATFARTEIAERFNNLPAFSTIADAVDSYERRNAQS